MAKGRNRPPREAESRQSAQAATQTTEADITASVLATLRLLRPQAVIGIGKRRIGGSHDGGYVMLDDFDGIDIAYSLGIGPDVSWDLALAERGAFVYQYDHTVPEVPSAHPRFQHIRTGISHSDTLSPDLRRLDTLMRSNGDGRRSDMILKIDIEGHEWDALDALDTAVFAQFRQIVAEFHGLRLLRVPSFRERAYRLFLKLQQTHQVVHVHGNNFSGMQRVGGIDIPDCLELTYVARDRYRFVPAEETLPGALDAPNDPARPDLPLGFLSSNAPPPVSARHASRSTQVQPPRGDTQTVQMPDYLVAAARQEMDRLTAQQPITPPGNTYQISETLLHDAAGYAGMGAWEPGADLPADPWAGLKENALAWSIRHIGLRLRDPHWRCLESPTTAYAVTVLTGFLHFHATWRHHPSFASMMARVAVNGFSLHALAGFAVAHCLAMQQNLISIPAASKTLGRFDIITGPTESVPVHTAVLDRFEMPFGKPWDAASLQTALAVKLAAVDTGQRSLLAISPGAVPAEFDAHLITALRQLLQRQGSRHRRLIAVLPIMLRLLPGPGAQAVRFGYAFHSVGNPASAG
ncbi:MAG TPA: FkbM family methyltransferase [Rhodopila sp.]|nr:FkbM family methyltransferase [Rhodopila sp.]